MADLRHRLDRYQSDVVTLWRENRTDWLLGTTLRLRRDGRVPARGQDGIDSLAWDLDTRLRMAPWVLAYYALVPLAAERIAARIRPALEPLVRPEHVLVHNHRIGREFLALASLQVARRRGLPFVLTPHHHPKWTGYRYQAWIKVYRTADAVLAHTTAEERELVRLGVDPKRIQVIWSAADDPLEGDPARFRQRFDDPAAPLVLFVGQLYAYKGVAELLEAVDLLHARGIRANLAYAGPHTPFSRRFFERRSRPWLRVLGPVSAQEKWDAIEAATVVCLPSRHEAFGRIYLEAWSRGKPVIGGRIPAVADVVEDGVTGLLVTPGSSEELSRALERLIEDPALASGLGRRGEEAVRERFNWPRVVARVEEAYDAARRRVAERTSLSGPRR